MFIVSWLRAMRRWSLVFEPDGSAELVKIFFPRGFLYPGFIMLYADGKAVCQPPATTENFEPWLVDVLDHSSSTRS